MLIKRQQSRPLLPKITFGRFVLFVLFFAAFLSGALTYRYLLKSGLADKVIKRAIANRYVWPSNYFKGIFLVKDEKKISIDIKFKDYQKILEEREKALKQYLITSSDENFVPATITYNGEKFPINIRLKGDAIDHIQGDKWSFRVKLKNDKTLWGMKEFSLHDPSMRNYLYEWVFHTLLKKEGLPTLRYEFIDVTLNGKHLGTYNLEEFFLGQMLVNNERPDAPILKFNDNFFFMLALRDNRPAHVEDPRDEIYISNPITLFGSSQLEDPALYAQFQTAKNLLEGFRSGLLAASQVFDVEKLAKLYAIVDLTDGWHGTAWTNVRLYFNPITSRLEPIGYDSSTEPIEPIKALLGQPRPANEIDTQFDFRHSVFKDKIFFAEYAKQLQKISEPAYLDKFFSETDNELKNNLYLIYRDQPDYVFNKDIYYQNQKFIRNALSPIIGLRAYFKNYNPAERKITLEIANIQGLPVEMTGLNLKDNAFTVFPFLKNMEYFLAGRAPYSNLNWQEFQFELPANFNWSDDINSKLQLNFKILGANNILNTEVIPWTHLDQGAITSIAKKQIPNHKIFNWLAVDEKNKTISVRPGWWSVWKDLIIPEGYTFIASPYTQLDLKNGSQIISYSPLRFIGSEKYPVKIISSDKTGKGILVLANDQKSYLQNVAVSNNLITLYESPAEIDRAQFIGGTNDDDTVHILRSDFKITNSLFKDNLSDGLDIDFGQGEISATAFINIGGDALDFSGSLVTLDKIDIKNAGDKGVSAGEDSKITIKTINIADSNIGLASKDLSLIYAETVKIINNKIGLTAFQKKPEFGPGRMIVVSLDITNTATPFLVEKKSYVEVASKAIEDKEINLKDKLYVQ